jgi:small subunit ribosomal protein S4
MKLFLKGERCYTEKCAIEKRNLPPGQHGKLRKAKVVGYGLQLREKQKVKRIYGVLENQFRRYFEMADRRGASPARRCSSSWSAAWTTSSIASGSATSRAQARQLARHGHFTVNGRKVDIPSYQVKPGDVVGVRASSAQNPAIQHALEEVKGRGVPEWLSFDPATMSGRIASCRRATDQPARAGAAHRRVVQQIASGFPLPASRVLPELAAGSGQHRSLPAAFPTCGGRQGAHTQARRASTTGRSIER